VALIRLLNSAKSKTLSKRIKFHYGHRDLPHPPDACLPVGNLLHYSHICSNIQLEVRLMKFVGVREFKQDVVKYLNEGNEIVVMKRKKPIARLTPVQKKSAEVILLEIGRVLSEAGVSKREALKALDRARREIYG
jgi:antitoxin (DNA-binding transcriptional repressor) of toxin-antitoxin stability system